MSRCCVCCVCVCVCVCVSRRDAVTGAWLAEPPSVAAQYNGAKSNLFDFVDMTNTTVPGTVLRSVPELMRFLSRTAAWLPGVN